MGIALHRCDLSTVTLVNRIQGWHTDEGQEFDELVAHEVLDQADRHDRLRQTWRIELEETEIGYLVVSRSRTSEAGADAQLAAGLQLYIRPEFRGREVTERAQRLARDLARSLGADAGGGSLPPLRAEVAV